MYLSKFYCANLLLKIVSSFYLVLSLSSFIAAQNCQHPSVFYNGTKLDHHNLEKAHTYVFKVGEDDCLVSHEENTWKGFN